MIESISRGEGNGGDISIKAEEITVTGLTGGWANTITASGYESGNAGSVHIEAADTLQLLDGGTIATDAHGAGNAGEIIVSAPNILLQNGARISTESSAGEGGSIRIAAHDLHMLNQTAITAKSMGAGNAGDIDLQVTSNLVSHESTINTEAVTADGGNIHVQVGNIARFIGGGVTASVGGGLTTTGGNLDLQARYVVLEDASLTANAFQGRGGNINIAAQAYLADPSSQVDASSQRGIDGIVDIQAPFSNLSGSLKPLPKEFLSAVNLLKKPCEARVRGGDYGSFIVRGLEAVPVEPGSLQMSPPQEF
jgi:hypothetical protein